MLQALSKRLAFFAFTFTNLVSALSAAASRDAVYESAARSGVPLKTLERALAELDKGIVERSEEACQAIEADRYTRSDVVTIFDLSKPSNQKRLFILNLETAEVRSYYAAHGVGNGRGAFARSLRNFNSPNSKKTPLGPLITSERGEQLRIPSLGRQDLALGIDGTKAYNNRINSPPSRLVPSGSAYAVHPAPYVSRNRLRSGKLGNSDGCIAIAEEVKVEVIRQIEGGSLIYIAVGDEPVENYLSRSEALRPPKRTNCFGEN